jgi:hypothetical protein
MNPGMSVEIRDNGLGSDEKRVTSAAIGLVSQTLQ